MNKFFAIFLCSICCMVQANHLSDLEDAIIKSDIEGVKTILAIISLTERNKVGLIDLANDIILRRLKNIEWLRYKKPSDPLKSSDFDKEYKELIDRHMEKMAFSGAVILLGCAGMLLTRIFTNNHNDELLFKTFALSSGALIVGFMWSAINNYKFRSIIQEKFDQAYTDAMKIKKLIHDKVCV